MNEQVSDARQKKADAQRRSAIEKYTETTQTISTRSIYIGFGLVGLCFSLLAAEPSTELTRSLTVGLNKVILLIAAFLGVATVLLDYLQNVFGLFSIQYAMNNEAGGYNYKQGSRKYQIALSLFWLKQGTAVLGTLFLCLAVVLSL